MKKIVVKHPISINRDLDDFAEVVVPVGSRMLHVDVDGVGQLSVWVECFEHDLAAFVQSGYCKSLQFMLVPTGKSFDTVGYVYYETFIVRADQTSVWHVYAREKELTR